MDVIPSINCADVECARATIARIRQLADRGLGNTAQWVHLDIADARFTFNRTWGDPLSWPMFGEGLNLEVHLMVEEPEQVIESWLKAGAKRIIVHLEAIEEGFKVHPEEPLSRIYTMRDACAAEGAEFVLGINSETPPERLAPYLSIIKKFMILSVTPGLAGQKFLSVSLYSIEWLRREAPHATIEVDGGMNPDTARQAKAVGADIIVAASFLLNHPEGVQKAMEILTKL